MCFLGEMVREINRKNIVPNTSRSHDSLLGPASPCGPHQGSSAEAQLLFAVELWDLGMCCREPQAVGELRLAPLPAAPT